MEFLGHQVGGDVITPNLEKVRNTPRPTTKKQVRSFLGLVGYYRDHIPAFAEISAPLTDLLKKRKAEHIQWSEAQERAYSLLKEYLLQEPVLKLPDLSKPFVLRTDASGVGVVAVLLQENDGKLYPVGYASKKLNLTEARYPIIEKECLAVVWGIKRFKLYLAGRRFTPLEWKTSQGGRILELTSSAGQDTRVDMLVISLICNNLYIVCILGNLYFVDIVDIALCVCRLLLYNNFKRGVMSQVNVCFAFRMLLYFCISNSVMLSSDNRNSLINGCSLQGTVLNMFSSVFDVVRYNSDNVL